MTLIQAEIFRYSRQFPVLGVRGQKQLKAAHVAVIGAGGLGCPALQALTTAGVGTLSIVDGDVVELSNLARQPLYQTEDLNTPKVVVAKSALLKLNPHTTIHAIAEQVSAENISAILPECDIVIDASDNFATRYLVNQHTRHLQCPLVSASIFQWGAQLSTFNLDQGPCYECLFPTPPDQHDIPDCAAGGVIGALTGVVGNLQALETIKIICKLGTTLARRVLTIDAFTLAFKQFKLPKAQTCPVHSCTKESPMTADSPEKKAELISPRDLADRLTHDKNLILLDVREDFERDICTINGARPIPLADLKTKAAELDPTKCYVVYCKAGLRGNKGALILKSLGFDHVYNLEGGILRWIDELDSTLNRY